MISSICSALGLERRARGLTDQQRTERKRLYDQLDAIESYLEREQRNFAPYLNMSREDHKNVADAFEWVLWEVKWMRNEVDNAPDRPCLTSPEDKERSEELLAYFNQLKNEKIPEWMAALKENERRRGAALCQGHSAEGPSGYGGSGSSSLYDQIDAIEKYIEMEQRNFAPYLDMSNESHKQVADAFEWVLWEVKWAKAEIDNARGQPCLTSPEDRARREELLVYVDQLRKEKIPEWIAALKENERRKPPKCCTPESSAVAETKLQRPRNRREYQAEVDKFIAEQMEIPKLRERVERLEREIEGHRKEESIHLQRILDSRSRRVKRDEEREVVRVKKLELSKKMESSIAEFNEERFLAMCQVIDHAKEERELLEGVDLTDSKVANFLAALKWIVLEANGVKEMIANGEDWHLIHQRSDLVIDQMIEVATELEELKQSPQLR